MKSCLRVAMFTEKFTRPNIPEKSNIIEDFVPLIGKNGDRHEDREE